MSKEQETAEIGSNIKDVLILNIPHSSTNIPYKESFEEDCDDELILTTDWATETIFDISDVTKIKADYSKIFCDVTRPYSDDESSNSWFKTITKDDIILRNNLKKQYVYKNYYKKYHKKFAKLVRYKLYKYNNAFIVNCRAFNNDEEYTEPFVSDFMTIHGFPEMLPDIILTIDSFHTPKSLIDLVKTVFRKYNFSVEIRNNQDDIMVPETYHNSIKNVKAITININKRLYMNEENDIDTTNVLYLNKMINEIFD